MLDEKDQQLLELLREHADWSTYQLSKRTGIPQTTVLNRRRKLKEAGVIKRYTIDIEHKRLGKNVRALIFVRVNKQLEKATRGNIGGIEAKVAKHPAVLSVKRLMGRIDFVIEVLATDVEELNRFLINNVRALDEVAETETCIVLGEWRS